MGEYLYGLRKLPKVKVVRVDGTDYMVQYKLEFKVKPSYKYSPFGNKLDAYSDSLYRRLEAKGTIQAYVIHGSRVLKWNGPAYWFDCGKTPFIEVGKVE